MLKRIVALLFAFAGLAEHLCGLPRPVRSFVLGILRFGEAVARDFVVEMADDLGAPRPPVFLVIPMLQGGDSPADAMRLAQSFRALAVLLDRLADRNPKPRKRSVTLAAYAAIARLSGGLSLELRRLCPAAAWSAVERSDSS